MLLYVFIPPEKETVSEFFKTLHVAIKLLRFLENLMGFPSDTVIKNPLAHGGDVEIWLQSLGQEDPLEEDMATHSSILLWKFHGQRTVAGYSLWGLWDMIEHAHTHENLILW